EGDEDDEDFWRAIDLAEQQQPHQEPPRQNLQKINDSDDWEDDWEDDQGIATKSNCPSPPRDVDITTC
ncbi:hypothetical protein F443_06913, partial [Phytophthora nicotianae P1569]